MSDWTAETDITLYPIKAVIAYRNAMWQRYSTRRLYEWCEMAAVPASAGPLAEPYKRWRHHIHDPLPDDPLLKLATLVVQMRAVERQNDPYENYWNDAWKSAEQAEKKGITQLPLTSETFEAWKARKATSPLPPSIL